MVYKLYSLSIGEKKMKKNVSIPKTIFIAFFAIFLCLISCTQSTKEKTVIIESPSESKTGMLHEKYNEYLLLMNEQQRSSFFKCQTDVERERFLQSESLDHQRYLRQNLKRGMASEKVLEILGNPITKEVNMNLSGKESRWTYSKFNGYRSVQYHVIFINNKLKEWTHVLPE